MDRAGESFPSLPIEAGAHAVRCRTNHWVKMHIKVPKDMIDKEVVQLEFDPSCEVSEPY